MKAPVYFHFFRPLNCCRAVLRRNGFHKECALYDGGGRLFARTPYGFTAMLADGNTSSKWRWSKVFFTDEETGKYKEFENAKA